ncbi:NmrA/HSCARG family protein [Brevibacterium sp. FME17]|uniref:NmrA/HSCARG family protein n=1 Tax=Brevibacterium sp. FME17 TaxID=2742606 RepID=UPI001868E572|nr:NmrA/HSCARG family protein [Brevibacterium sp. FME17]
MAAETQGPIAVFGATGKQGGAVVDALVDQGAHVRALVRSPESERARSLADRGVELAYADADEPTSLAAALEGATAFFFMTLPPGGMGSGDTEGESQQGLALAQAAAAAGVPHIVFNSVGGAERNSGVPHFESKRRVEAYLEDLDMAVTLIRPVFFMDNLAAMGPQLDKGELVLRLPLPDGIKLQMIAVRDIGIVAASALLGTADIRGGAIEIAGDERTGTEIARAFGEHTGLSARYEELPIETLEGDADMQAMFRWFAETPAYQADLDEVRSIAPKTLDLPAWLVVTGYSAR